MKHSLNKIFNKKRKGVIAYFMAIFGALIFITVVGMITDAAIALNIRYEFQKAVEKAALTSISDFEITGRADNNMYGLIGMPTTADFLAYVNENLNAALEAFKNANAGSLQSVTMTPTIVFDNNSRHSKAILISANIVANTYFLKTVGIKSIKLNASAAAVNVPVYIGTKDLIINRNLISSYINSTQLTDLFDLDGDEYLDTDIVHDSGGTREAANNAANCSDANGADSYGDCTTETVNIHNRTAAMVDESGSRENAWGIAGPTDGYVLSLGKGGYVTIKLPKPLIDGRGMDLQIITRGNRNGYYLLAGVDADPNRPYKDSENPGGGIKWENIGCTGIPINVEIGQTNGDAFFPILYPSTRDTTLQTTYSYEPIFYGSGYFDLNAACGIGSEWNSHPDMMGVYYGYNAEISVAKYLKIIDDNYDAGFLQADTEHPETITNWIKYQTFTGFPGQGASMTPGVSIDSIAILHHPRLISKADFYDRDATTGLIKKVQALYEGHGNDYRRFWGCLGLPANQAGWATCTSVLDDGGSGTVYIGNPTNTDYKATDSFDTIILK